jgi:hypothetical protein
MSFNSRYSQQIKQKTPSDAKGLEKVIISFSFAVVDISSYVNTIFYGKSEMPASDKGKRRKNPLDMGVIPILDILASIDLCDLLNYLTNALGNINIGSGTFNPTKQPEDFFGKIKWRFQKTAYDVQTEIDGFYNDFNNLDTPESKIGVLRVLTKIRSEFAGFTQVISNLSNPDRLAATDPDVLLLLDAFPQLKNIGNYVNDTLSYFDRFTDYRQLQNEDVQKIVDTIKKIRQYCIAIQALNNPSAIVSQYGADLLKDEISQLLKDIDVQDVVPTLKKINETLKKIIAICNNINNIIQFATTIIRLFSTLIFVFRVIIRFLKTLPAPNQFTTVGVTNTASDVLNEIKKKGPTTFEVRLAQISSLLGSITLLLNTLLPIINEVIQKVNNLLANLQNCDNAPEDLKNSMQDTVDNLQSSVNTLQAFLDNKTQNDLTRSDTQLGEYTIQIITEQVTDETFNLRRRYGVALNNSGIVQVTSQPTFASDDNVIINEVKLLLQQAGLIQEGSGIYTDSELNTLNQANSYLFNDNINTQPDLSQINAFDSDQSSITNYISSTDGNSQLRKRARAALNRNRQNLSRILGGNPRR